MMDSNAFEVTGIDAAQDEAKAKKCRRLILLTLLENEHTHVKLENASVPLSNRVARQQPTLPKLKRRLRGRVPPASIASLECEEW